MSHLFFWEYLRSNGMGEFHRKWLTSIRSVQKRCKNMSNCELYGHDDGRKSKDQLKCQFVFKWGLGIYAVSWINFISIDFTEFIKKHERVLLLNFSWLNLSKKAIEVLSLRFFYRFLNAFRYTKEVLRPVINLIRIWLHHILKCNPLKKLNISCFFWTFFFEE